LNERERGHQSVCTVSLCLLRLLNTSRYHFVTGFALSLPIRVTTTVYVTNFALQPTTDGQ